MRQFAALVFLATLPGLALVRFANEASSFYTPDPLMLKGEKAVAEALGGGETSFAVTEGATLQEALELEERKNVAGLSAMIPSEKTQAENRRLISNFAAADREAVPPPPDFNPVTPGNFPLSCEWFVVRKDASGACMLIAPGGTDFSPKAELERLFAALSRETALLVSVSLAVLLAVLALMRSLKLFLPVLASVVSTLGVLGYLGRSVNFFQLVAFFVIVGLGLDYAIFHSDPSRRRIVLAGFLTSLAGLGSLAFTSFAVTSSMGVTFAIGLFFAWFYSRHVVRAA